MDARYQRQVRFAPFGETGQESLANRRVLLCGCGALGSVQAEILTRAGVGALRIVDRDFVELSNLHRQVLFNEDDVRNELPKAIAARDKLQKINGQVEIEAHVCDLDFANLPQLLNDVDCICDGTDNFETRFLLNDASLHYGIPWIYGGCVGAEGQQLTVVPGETPCLRCLMPEIPPPGSTATCDTAGVLGPIVQVVAAMQAMEAIKILGGHRDAISRTWNVIDLWDSRLRQINVASLREQGDCPACGHGEFPFLAGDRGSHSSVLCGRNAVQLSFPGKPAVDLPSLAEQLRTLGTVRLNPFLLRADVGGYTFTVFPDGRTIVTGTEDIAEAKTAHAKFIGS